MPRLHRILSITARDGMHAPLMMLAGVLVFAWTAPFARGEEAHVLSVPQIADRVTIDGRLDEPCYQSHPPLTAFVNAADPTAKVPATKAWLFWSEERLAFAFDCQDSTLSAAEPGKDEHDVDRQDRVELFLWPGAKDGPYYCLEIAPRGSLHDYQARLYRKFDDDWQASGLEFKTFVGREGYTVEGSLSKEGLTKIGLKLSTGQTWRGGLFRADFDRLGGTPTWITWVTAKTKEPDFHVWESFGVLRLDGPARK